jgi:hypothetical protein
MNFNISSLLFLGHSLGRNEGFGDRLCYCRTREADNSQGRQVKREDSRRTEITGVTRQRVRRRKQAIMVLEGGKREGKT